MTDDQLTAADLPLPGGSFRLFITRLSYQGLMSLGIIENPLTNTKAMNLPNAKMLIEDLEMIRDKTRGNLEEDEDEYEDEYEYEFPLILRRFSAKLRT